MKSKTTKGQNSNSTESTSNGHTALPATNVYTADLGLQAFGRLKAQIMGQQPAKHLGTDISKVCAAAYAVGQRMVTGPFYPALTVVSQIDSAKVGGIVVFEIKNVDQLQDAALACQYCRDQADIALSKESKAKIPAPLARESADVESRMQKACTHTLGGIPDAATEIARLKPGTDYLDRADDLRGYANLYDLYPNQVKLDGMNYQEGDSVLARQLAQQVVAAVGASLSEQEQTQIDTLRRSLTFLLGVYGECQRIGILLLHGDPSAAALFPSLFAVGRSPQKKRASKTNGAAVAVKPVTEAAKTPSN